MNRHAVAALIDHTLLKPEATAVQIDALCAKAVLHDFKTVCVNPRFVERCARALAGSGVGTCTVVGFPLGANDTSTKVEEATHAIAQGANEIDMVLWIGGVISGEDSLVEKDIRAVAEVCKDRAALKVILETAALAEAQIVAACNCCVRAGAQWVKTSTGFGPGGATVDVVRIMHQTVGKHGLKVKASGGIRSLSDLLAMCDAGAERIGTSSGVEILAELPY